MSGPQMVARAALGLALATTLVLGAGGSPSGADPGDGSTPGVAEAPEGRALSWQPAGQWQTGRPVTSIDLDPSDRLVVATRDRRVRTYDRRGDVVRRFRVPVVPGSIDVAPDGDVHLMPNERAGAGVARTMRVLGPRGRPKRTYGSSLPESGGFEVGAAGRRVVFADAVGGSVVVYDVATGRQVDRWGRDGTEGIRCPRCFNFPGDVAQMGDDRLALADNLNAKIKVFGLDRTFERQMGGRYAQEPFRRGVPRVAYGGGRHFGLDPDDDRPGVVVFGADGELQRVLDGRLSGAADLAVTDDGRTLYVGGRLPSGEPGVIRYVRR